MKISFVVKLSVLLVLAVSFPCSAITAPVAYWTFNNEQGQTAGTYDGIVNDQGAGAYNLYVDHYTSGVEDINPDGQNFFQNPNVYSTGGAGPTNSDGTPAEHYVTSGSISPGAGTAYHMEGGKTYQYFDTFPAGGDGIYDPQLDASEAYAWPQQFFSWRDRLEVESTEEGVVSPDRAGVFDSRGSGNGSITYAFWLNIRAAGAADTTRFFSNSSFLIGRGSGGPLSQTGGGGYGGEISIGVRSGGGTTFNPYRYGLQVRNDCNGEAGCTNGIQRTGETSGFMDAKGGEWHHWVVQYDMTDLSEGNVQIWMDGGLLNTGGGQLGPYAGQQTLFTGMGASPITGRFRLNNVAHPAADPNATNSNQFAAQQKESGDFYIDDLAVWSGALLSDQDVYDIFSQGIGNLGFTPGPEFNPADIDQDGDVDTDDLTTMFQNFTGSEGGGKSHRLGDTDMDGDVDTADLTLAFQNFTGAQNASLGSDLQEVPEPSSALLIVLGAVGCVIYNRKRFSDRR